MPENILTLPIDLLYQTWAVVLHKCLIFQIGRLYMITQPAKIASVPVSNRTYYASFNFSCLFVCIKWYDASNYSSYIYNALLFACFLKQKLSMGLASLLIYGCVISGGHFEFVEK